MSQATIVAKLPGAAVTSSDLPLAGNDGGSPLTADVDNDDLTFPVQELANYPTPCIVRIGNERILITSRSASSGAGNLVTSSTANRGYDGSTAAAHKKDARVYLVYSAYLHNRIQAELIVASQMLTGATAFSGTPQFDAGIAFYRSAAPANTRKFRATMGDDGSQGYLDVGAYNDADALIRTVLRFYHGGEVDLVSGGAFRIGGVTLFEGDRDLAVTLLPNATGTLDLGSTTREFRNAYFASGGKVFYGNAQDASAGFVAGGSGGYFLDTDGTALIPTTVADVGAAANAAWAAGASIVLLKDGTYTQSTGVVIPAGKELHGAGKMATVINAAAGITSITLNGTYCRVQNLRVVFQGASVNNTAVQVGDGNNSATVFELSNLHLLGVGNTGTGVWNRGSFIGGIRGVYAEAFDVGCLYDSNAVAGSACNAVAQSFNRWINCNTGWKLGAGGATDIEAFAIAIEGCSTGFDDGGLAGLDTAAFVGCHFENLSTAGSTNLKFSGACPAFVVTGCDFSSVPAQRDIVHTGSGRVIANGCLFNSGVQASGTGALVLNNSRGSGANGLISVGGGQTISGEVIGHFATGAFVSFYDAVNGATRGYLGYGSTLVGAAVISDFILRAEGAVVFAAGGGTEVARFTTTADFVLNGTTLFEGDRDLAVNLIPNADNTLTLGSAARRWSEANSASFSVYAAASDANRAARLNASGLFLGAGGASALDGLLKRSTATRWQLRDAADAAYLGLDLLELVVGGTVVFESDRDIAVSLIPNAAGTLDLGSSTRVWNNLHVRTITIDNQGAGADPSLFSSSGSQILDLTGTFRINPGTSPQDAIVFNIAALSSVGQRDSHILQMVGQAHDGVSAYTTNWYQQVDITTNTGGSSFLWRSRIGAATITTRMSLSDAGLLDVLGGLAVAGTTVFESDRDLAVDLIPSADDARSLGSSARQFQNLYLVRLLRMTGDGAAAPFIELRSDSTTEYGIRWMDVGGNARWLATRGTSNEWQLRDDLTALDPIRFEVTLGGDVRIPTGSLSIGGTVLFESDRDLAVSLLPNADNTLDLGSSTRKYRALYLGATAPTAANTGQLGYANGGLQLADGTVVRTILQTGASDPAEVVLTNNTNRTPSTTRGVWVTVVADYNTLASNTTVTATVTVGATTYTLTPRIRNFDAVTAQRLTAVVGVFFVPPNTAYKVNMSSATNLTLHAWESTV